MPSPTVIQKPNRFSGISQGMQPLQQLFMMKLMQKRQDKLAGQERDQKIMDQVRGYIPQGYEVVDPGILPEGEKPDMQWELSNKKKIGLKKRQLGDIEIKPLGEMGYHAAIVKDTSGKVMKTEILNPKSEKDPTMIGLHKRATAGDEIAKAILDSMEKREIRIKKAIQKGSGKGAIPEDKKPSVSEEKFKFQKEATLSELRSNIMKEKDKQNFYSANAPFFNKNNTNNEVAYWHEEPRLFGDSEAKIIKLPKQAIDAGWTPNKVQEAANARGISVRQVLVDIGIIKGIPEK